MRVRVRVCMCMSCCVHTPLLMPHTSYIYAATQDMHMLANSATFGFNFYFCCSAKGIVDLLDFIVPFVVDPRSDNSQSESETNDENSFHPTKSQKLENSPRSRQVTARGHQSG